MDKRAKACGEVVNLILTEGAYKATKYLNSKLTVKATRKKYKGKVSKSENADIVVTIGKPNYEEREYLKRIGYSKVEFTPFIRIKLPKV
jgi:hypothetical protein